MFVVKLLLLFFKLKVRVTDLCTGQQLLHVDIPQQFSRERDGPVDLEELQHGPHDEDEDERESGYDGEGSDKAQQEPDQTRHAQEGVNEPRHHQASLDL